MQSEDLEEVYRYNVLVCERECVYMCVCVCVCERESVNRQVSMHCVCVCVCVWGGSTVGLAIGDTSLQH